MITSLRIGEWNANGALNRLLEIELFLKTQHIDILLLSETHFTQKTHFYIPNYSVYHTTRPDHKAHGGSAVVIKNNIKHYELAKLSTIEMQATSIMIRSLIGDIAVSAVYCPPGHKFDQLKLNTYFSDLGYRFISGGDWNAKNTKWGSRFNNARGNILNRVMQGACLGYIATGEPTYWPTDVNKLPDALDFFITKGIALLNTQSNSCLDLSSDHSAIILTVSTGPIVRGKAPYLCNKWTNWNVFQEELNNQLHPKISLKTEFELDIAVKYFTETIQSAAWKSTPEIKKLPVINNVPQHVSILVKEKRKLRNKWQKTRNPFYKKLLNKKSKQLKILLREIKNDVLQNYLQNLAPSKATDYNLWKAVKSKNRPTEYIPPLRKADGAWARNDEEKAKLFAEHYTEIFKPHPTSTDTEDIFEFLDAPLQLSVPITPASPGEIKNIIHKLDKNKSPGHDLIVSKILQELPNKAILFLTNIFNAVFRLQYFPLSWKLAQIIVIHKLGKAPENVESYRPISLLPILSKILEKLILKRLYPILINHIPDYQFGFRKKHSTIEQVHRIVQIIQNSLEAKETCTGVFLDVKQAFDKVWHPGLLYKLKKVVPHPLYLLLKSYLQERSFYVKLHDERSEIYSMSAGVPQGSVLGPVLYTLYTSDFPDRGDVNTAMFADDTALIAVDKDNSRVLTKLQTALAEIEIWLKRWRVRVNESKCAQITFTLKNVVCPSVKINGKIVPQQDEVKYLGIHLDKKLTWATHVDKKRKQLDIKLRQLHWMLGRCTGLSIENKLLIYKIIVKPVWTYGLMLWGCAKDTHVNKIQRFQNKAVRLIVSPPWYVTNDTLHRDFKIPYIREEFKKQVKKYVCKLENHENILAINLLDNSKELRRLQRNRTFDFV